MNKDQILEQLSTVFKSVFQMDSEISEQTGPPDIESWDSLNHIALLASIEESFNVKFNIKEMRSLNQVADIVETIEKKLVNRET